jgi:hypothetical protein
MGAALGKPSLSGFEGFKLVADRLVESGHPSHAASVPVAPIMDGNVIGYRHRIQTGRSHPLVLSSTQRRCRCAYRAGAATIKTPVEECRRLPSCHLPASTSAPS